MFSNFISTVFDFSDTNRNDTEIENTVVVKDPKCARCQKPNSLFHCTNCLKSGNFSMSKKVKNSDFETFYEKKQALEKLKKETQEQSDLYDQRIEKAKAYENLKFEVEEKQRKLEVLKKIIAEKRAKIKLLNKEKEKLQQQNTELDEQVSDIHIQTCKFKEQLISRQQKNEILNEKHVRVNENVGKASRFKIEQLVEYIFPISIEQRNEGEQTAVARRTQDDDWVFYANGIDEVQYRIVGPTLPANGNYAAYLEPTEDKQFTENDMQPRRNAEYRILGALTYTTQLVQLMYHCLGVRMPHKLTYGVFCKEMNHAQILKKIMKLNTSIMYLAYTQNVKMHQMNENHTLENILIILDTKRSDLGRFGFHAVDNAPLVKSVDSLLVDIDDITQEISDSDAEENSESDISFCLDLDDLPEAESLMEHETNAVMSQSFISSAVNQITSIFGLMK